MTPDAPPSGTTDPRPALGAEQDVRLVVEHPRAGLSGVAIACVAGIGALALFATLEARRQAASAPATMMAATGTGVAASPPPLYLPPEPEPPAIPYLPIVPGGSAFATPPRNPAPAAPAITTPTTLPVAVNNYVAPSPAPYTSLPAASQPPRNVGGQALIVDTSGQGSATPADGKEEDAKAAGGKRSALSTTRARAAMFANRSTTVPQGTLISAVLETAFDSTSPGFARALVQKDIYGFDGTRVLIQRGSRLIGEYGEDVKSGQRRAVILWARLIRPDGVTIAIGSPAADTLGRGGVKADVNTHFLERFSGAILQSTLNVGVALAARSSSSPVIVALPSSASSLTSAASATTTGTDIAPTLRVPAGRSVSVFVARDLDFTGSDAVR